MKRYLTQYTDSAGRDWAGPTILALSFERAVQKAGDLDPRLVVLGELVETIAEADVNTEREGA